MQKVYLSQLIVLADKLRAIEPLDIGYSGMVLAELQTGHVDSAKTYLSLLKKLSDSNACSVCATNYYSFAGLFYKNQGNYRAALPYMIESLNLDIARMKENPTINLRTSLAGNYLNIGNTFNSLGEYRNSLQNHLKALQLFEELDNKRGISFSYQAVGTDFLMLAQFR